MAGEEWFYLIGDEEVGPVSSGDLKQLAANGTLAPDDVVWKQDWPERRRARSIKGLFRASAPEVPKPPLDRRPPEAIRAATQAADDVSQKLWFLDLKFQQFATPRLIGFVFVVALLILLLTGVGAIGYALWTLPAIQAAFVSLVIVIEIVFFAVVLRVFLECCLIAFRISDHLSHLRHLRPNDVANRI